MQQWFDATMVYLPSFLAKSDNDRFLHRRIQLKPIKCAATSNERFLCPVCALLNLRYLIHTHTNPQLFQAPDRHAFSVRQLLCLLTGIIKEAHRSIDEEGAHVQHMRCHDVRAVAASHLWLSTRDWDTVSSAFSWMNRSTFVAHYSGGIAALQDIRRP